MEFCDYDYKYKSDDGTLTEDLAMTKNDDIILNTSRDLGREPCPGPKLKEWVQQGGFTNVVERAYKLPIGPWPKDPRMVSRTSSYSSCIANLTANLTFLQFCSRKKLAY